MYLSKLCIIMPTSLIFLERAEEWTDRIDDFVVGRPTKLMI